MSLVLVLSVSTVGVAKITHFCKMAATSASQDCCEPTPKKYDCCEGDQADEQDDCCTNDIQFFKADYQNYTPTFWSYKFAPTSCISFTSPFQFQPPVIHSNLFQGTYARCGFEPNGPPPNILFSVFLI